VLDGAAAICAEAGIAIPAVTRSFDEEPKFGLSSTGTIHPDRIVSNAGARPRRRVGVDQADRHGVLTTAVSATPPPEKRAGRSPSAR